MRLERATAYGILALAHMAARKAKAPQQVHHISKETGVPVEYLRKLMGRLARARLIISTRGRHGGFMLARPANKITMLQIVEAIEGPIDPTSVLHDDLAFGRKDATAKRLQRWRHDAAMRLRKMLESTTLGNIVGAA
jgi:Rrf2 family protein